MGCKYCDGSGWINGHSCPSCNHDHMVPGVALCGPPTAVAYLDRIPDGWTICDGWNGTLNVTEEGISRLSGKLMRR